MIFILKEQNFRTHNHVACEFSEFVNKIILTHDRIPVSERLPKYFQLSLVGLIPVNL